MSASQTILAFAEIPPAIWVVGGLVALMTLLAVLYSSVVEKKALEFEEAAKTLNFEYLGKMPDGLPKDVARFGIFGQGNLEQVDHAMRGEANGIEVTLFQLSTTGGLGAHARVTSQTVACFRTDQMNLPWVFVRPNAVFGKQPAPMGMSELRLPGGFAERYSICAEDVPRAEKMITQQVMDQLSASAGLVCAEGRGEILIVYYPGRPFRLKDAPQFLQDAFRVFSIFKQASAALPPASSSKPTEEEAEPSAGV